MHNDAIEARKRKLSPEAQAALEEIARGENMAAPGTPGPETKKLIVGRLVRLSERDRAEVRAMLDARGHRSWRKADEAGREAGEEIQQALEFICRAQDLYHAQGKTVVKGGNMTLNEAVERLREAGRLSEEDERFAEQIRDKTVEVPVTEKIKHRRAWIRVPPDRRFEDLPAEEQWDLRISWWLESHYLRSMRIAAAAVLASSGSLIKLRPIFTRRAIRCPVVTWVETKERGCGLRRNSDCGFGSSGSRTP